MLVTQMNRKVCAKIHLFDLFEEVDEDDGESGSYSTQNSQETAPFPEDDVMDREDETIKSYEQPTKRRSSRNTDETLEDTDDGHIKQHKNRYGEKNKNTIPAKNIHTKSDTKRQDDQNRPTKHRTFMDTLMGKQTSTDDETNDKKNKSSSKKNMRDVGTQTESHRQATRAEKLRKHENREEATEKNTFGGLLTRKLEKLKHPREDRNKSEEIESQQVSRQQEKSAGNLKGEPGRMKQHETYKPEGGTSNKHKNLDTRENKLSVTVYKDLDAESRKFPQLKAEEETLSGTGNQQITNTKEETKSNVSKVTEINPEEFADELQKLSKQDPERRSPPDYKPIDLDAEEADQIRETEIPSKKCNEEEEWCEPNEKEETPRTSSEQGNKLDGTRESVEDQLQARGLTAEPGKPDENETDTRGTHNESGLFRRITKKHKLADERPEKGNKEEELEEQTRKREARTVIMTAATPTIPTMPNISEAAFVQEQYSEKNPLSGTSFQENTKELFDDVSESESEENLPFVLKRYLP